ncbi:MAG: ribonuclease PH, partial [Parvibaculum sp.]|nr:ribonuclease PH [Parvibaculum sp.]
FSEDEFLALLKLAKGSVADLVRLQKEAISK